MSIAKNFEQNLSNEVKKYLMKEEDFFHENIGYNDSMNARGFMYPFSERFSSNAFFNKEDQVILRKAAFFHDVDYENNNENELEEF